MSEEARFSFSGLDRVMHERARLGILSCLITHRDGMVFSHLKELCDLTDGNLNRHLKVLDDAGFIETLKSGAGRNRQTQIRLTEHGHAQFVAYLEELKSVIEEASTAAQENATLNNFGWTTGS